MNVHEPYDIVKVPYDFLPDKLLSSMPFLTDLLFETFMTKDLDNEYETYYIDTQGRLFIEKIAHVVSEKEKGKSGISRNVIMKQVKSHKLSNIYAEFSGKTYNLELLFNDGFLHRINLKSKK